MNDISDKLKNVEELDDSVIYDGEPDLKSSGDVDGLQDEPAKITFDEDFAPVTPIDEGEPLGGQELGPVAPVDEIGDEV